MHGSDLSLGLTLILAMILTSILAVIVLIHVCYYTAYRSLYRHMVCNVPVSRKANGDRNQIGCGVTVTQKLINTWDHFAFHSVCF